MVLYGADYASESKAHLTSQPIQLHWLELDAHPEQSGKALRAAPGVSSDQEFERKI